MPNCTADAPPPAVAAAALRMVARSALDKGLIAADRVQLVRRALLG
jgi:hypothetical protein